MSVIGDILDVIKTRCASIQIGGGYTFDVGTISRATRRGDFPKGDGDIVIYHEEPERNEELSKAGNPPLIAYDMNVKVVCFIRQTTAQGTTEALSDIETDRWEDMARAIMSIDRWHTFGDNAINGQAGAITNETDDDGTSAACFNVLITYRVREAVPSVPG